MNKDPATSARQPRQGTNHQTCITKLQGVDVLVCGKCFWPFAGRASQSGHLEAAHWPKAEFTSRERNEGVLHHCEIIDAATVLLRIEKSHKTDHGDGMDCCCLLTAGIEQ